MPIKKYTTEQIIGLLRDAEILLAEGNTVAMASKRLGIAEQTYYRWRKEYGGMKVSHAKRLKDLEKENSRLKKLLAEAELDKAILKEAASGNF
jgi:transposase-like protein